MHSNQGINPYLQRRRTFIKTTGGASLASIVAWQGLARPVIAQEGGGSQVEWGMRCHAPQNNTPGGPPASPNDGWYELYKEDPIGGFAQATVNGVVDNYQKWYSIKIKVLQSTRTSNQDTSITPYNGPVLVQWQVVEARTWWRLENEGTPESHTQRDLKVALNVIQRSASASCDTQPGEKEIVFAITTGEQEEETDSATGIKVKTEVKVEPENQEGLIQFKASVFHPSGGQSDVRVVDSLFIKEPKS